MHPPDESDARPDPTAFAKDKREDFEDSALDAAECHVAGSADAGRSCDGGRKAFSATFAALCEWGEAQKLVRQESDFDFFGRQPDGYGDEHQAWFDEPTKLWFKATYHNRFGLAWGREGTANAREYLTRLILQNTYFGDDIRLVALVNCQERLRILISQPHVAGQPAPYKEIQEWFEFLGFLRIETAGRVAWYLREENLLVADAHEGNVIRTRSPQIGQGFLVPIDLNLVQPNGNLSKWLRPFIARLSDQN